MAKVGLFSVASFITLALMFIPLVYSSNQSRNSGVK